MKIVARDSSGIIVRIEASELLKADIQTHKARPHSYQPDPVPEADIEARLLAVLEAHHELTMLAGIGEYEARQLRSTAERMERFQAKAKEIRGRLKPAEKKEG